MQQQDSWWERFKTAEWNWLHPGPDEIHPWRWRALGLWIVVFTAIVIYNLHDSGNVSKRASDAAFQAKDAIARVQTQRSEAIGRNCEEQNDRHSNTLITLRVVLEKQIEQQHLATPAGLKKIKKYGSKLSFYEISKTVPKKMQKQVMQSVGTTVLLINALAPEQNCEDVVHKAVKNPPATTQQRKDFRNAQS